MKRRKAFSTTVAALIACATSRFVLAVPFSQAKVTERGPKENEDRLSLQMQGTIRSKTAVAEAKASNGPVKGRSQRRVVPASVDKEEIEFYDLDSFDEDGTRKLVEAAVAINHISNSVDWDKMRDEYILASLSASQSASTLTDVRPSQGIGKDAESEDDDEADAFGGDDDSTHLSASGDRPIREELGRKRRRLPRRKRRRKRNSEVAETPSDEGLVTTDGAEEDGNEDSSPRPGGGVNVGGFLDYQINEEKQKEEESMLISTTDEAVFAAYEYDLGACPNAGSLGVPCADPLIRDYCNKYNRTVGSFRTCIDKCAPSFCCIHDASRSQNFLAPNCNTDENCAQYAYCYIAWFKLHDTIGPALFLQLESNDDWFDVEANSIESDQTGDAFFEQVLLHHFDDIQRIIDAGTENNNFLADRVFLNETFWSLDV